MLVLVRAGLYERVVFLMITGRLFYTEPAMP